MTILRGTIRLAVVGVMLAPPFADFGGGALSAAQPGWYPSSVDPSLERYWDGSRWTTHARRHGVGSSSPRPPYQALSPQPARSSSEVPKLAGYGPVPVPGGYQPPTAAGHHGANRPNSPQRPGRILAVVLGLLVLAVVVFGVVRLIVSESPDPATADSGSGSAFDDQMDTADVESIAGVRDDWIESVCKTGTFVDGHGGLPGSSGGALCQARVGRGDYITMSQFDSDYKMRNALAMAQIDYYVSGIEPSGEFVCFSVLPGSSSRPLEPLIQFGFTINRAASG